jgi:hypothetical protein
MLDQLEELSRYEPWLPDEDDDAITQANYGYSRSAKENLERATDDLRNWYAQLEQIIGQTRVRPGY